MGREGGGLNASHNCHIFTNDMLLTGVWFSLLPIVAGIAIVAVSDLSFTALSMAVTFLANICFVLRSLFVKKIFSSGVCVHLIPRSVGRIT